MKFARQLLIPVAIAVIPFYSAQTLSAIDTQPPSVPSSLTIISKSDTSITLSWKASIDDVLMKNYKIYRNGHSITSVNGTSNADSPLLANTSYSYTVSAVDAAGNESAQSYPMTATTLAAGAVQSALVLPATTTTTSTTTLSTTDIQPPTAPGSLRIVSKTASSLSFSWNPSTDNVQVYKYKIYRNSREVTTVNGTSSSDSGFPANSTYIYTVSALDAAGNESAQSNSITFTSGTGSTSTADTQAPTVPQNLKTSAATQTAIQLLWTVSTDNVGVSGYHVFRNGAEIGKISGNTYSDSNLIANTQYSYSVSAYDLAGNQSGKSSSLNASTLPSPVTGDALINGPVPNSLTKNIYYVDQSHPAASDANTGTREEEPWKTPDKAFATVQPGDFVYIKGSTNPASAAAIYDRTLKNGFNIVTPGQAGKMITFRSYPGHTVIMQGNGSRVGILLDKASYHHFYGFVVRDFQKSAEGTGLKTDIIIEKSVFTKTYEAGLRLRDVTNVVLRDVYIHHCYESGVSVRNGKNVLFERVESSYNDDYKGVDGDGDGFHTYGGENITFINAVARGNSEDGFDLNANAVLINVLSENNPAVNLKLWRRAEDNYAPKQMYIINSVFRNAGEAGIKISEGAQMFLYNSVVYNSGEEGIGFRTPSNLLQVPVTSLIVNSIIANNRTGVLWYKGNLVSEHHNLYFQNQYLDTEGFTVNSSSLIDEDPMFVNAAGGNFHIMSGSPAIDAGIILSNIYTLKDIDGNVRSIGTSFDIGVDEK